MKLALRQTARLAIAVFVVALVARAALALWLPDEIIWPDGRRYEKIALSLLAGTGFGDLVDNRRSVPTQPLLIAAVYFVFGKSYAALRLISAVLGAASCVIGFFLARRLFGTTTAIFAGVILALYPHLAYASALFEYPQTLGILLIGAFLLAQLDFSDTGRLRALAGASLLLGLTVLTLPSLLLYVPVFVLLSMRRSQSLRRNAVQASIAFAGVALVIAPWAYRNYVAYDRVVLINAAGGDNFWIANNATYARYGKPAVVGRCSADGAESTFCREYRQLIAEVRASGASRQEQVFMYEKRAWEKGWTFARDTPLVFLQLAIEKFFRFWSPWPDAVHTGPAHGGEWRNVLSALFYVPLLTLAALGVAMSWRAHGVRLIPLYGFAIMYVAPFALFLPTMRYRLPVDFLMGIFAAVPLAYARNRWRMPTSPLSPLAPKIG
jgi:4-amino-4-deoxy-L-arabinose transferase-like glycosyltransferase